MYTGHLATGASPKRCGPASRHRWKRICHDGTLVPGRELSRESKDFCRVCRGASLYAGALARPSPKPVRWLSRSVCVVSRFSGSIEGQLSIVLLNRLHPFALHRSQVRRVDAAIAFTPCERVDANNTFTSCESLVLIYRTVPVIWRSLGQGNLGYRLALCPGNIPWSIRSSSR